MSDVYDNGFGFEFDSDPANEESLYRGNFVEKEGYYHVTIEPKITLSEADSSKLRTVDIQLRILAGCDLDGKDASDQIDKVVNHSIFIEGWVDPKDRNAGKQAPNARAVGGMKVLFYACGVISGAELGETKFRPNFLALAGRQMVVKLSRDDDWEDKDGKSHKGRIKLRWNSDCFPIGHERVQHVPVNAMLALAGGYDSSKHGTPSGSGQSAVNAAASLV